MILPKKLSEIVSDITLGRHKISDTGCTEMNMQNKDQVPQEKP